MNPLWHRSVKRKLHRIYEDGKNPRLKVAVPAATGDGGGNGNDFSARVEVENEVAALREAVSRQNETIQDLLCDLEEERNAASTAASEAMSMILRLQGEKAEIQMEFRQFKRFAEDKMAHDQEQLIELDELLFKQDQALQSLSCQIKEYKHRLINNGLLDAENRQQLDDFYYDYPPLKCTSPCGRNCGDRQSEEGGEGSVFDMYSPTMLNQLQSRICEMEAEESVVRGSNEEFMNKVLQEEEVLSGGKGRNSDDESARVYIIDAIHGASNVEMSHEERKGNSCEIRKETMGEGDIKKLYLRLQALEADRESMRQAIISMRTEKAQLLLLKEIAQQLCKEGTPLIPGKTIINKPSHLFNSSFVALTKWVISIIFRKRKASRTKYSFGLLNNNVGLLLLLDKSHLNQWRCLARTRN